MKTNENSSNIGNSPPDVSIPCFVPFNIFIYNELAPIICLSYMQLKKIVASIIQSHRNEVSRDVKIMIDQHFALMSEDILSALSKQSEISKDGTVRKSVDTRIHVTNEEAMDATGNSIGHADRSTIPFHKSCGPIVMDDHQDPLVSPQPEDLLVGLQQKDLLVTPHQEAPFISTQ
jgi:hypothetical protein